ncbi:hypothetical protein H4582DRAFT_2063808 [Lactarius indigo]|nr:hypothetical protein H4582DRAFT_2063808 [Lactarius indigo]
MSGINGGVEGSSGLGSETSKRKREWFGTEYVMLKRQVRSMDQYDEKKRFSFVNNDKKFNTLCADKKRVFEMVAFWPCGKISPDAAANMFFDYLRSVVRLAWGWVRRVAIEPVGGWMRRRALRAEVAVSAHIRILSGAEEVIDLAVRLALPRGTAAGQGEEAEQV